MAAQLQFLNRNVEYTYGAAGEVPDMQAKRVKDSAITIVYQMTHQDANLDGIVRGGVTLGNIDNTAGMVASRHSNANAVTTSIDRVDFYSAAYVGDLLRVLASVNYTGNTSMEIGAGELSQLARRMYIASPFVSGSYEAATPDIKESRAVLEVEVLKTELVHREVYARLLELLGNR